MDKTRAESRSEGVALDRDEEMCETIREASIIENDFIVCIPYSTALTSIRCGPCEIFTPMAAETCVGKPISWVWGKSSSMKRYSIHGQFNVAFTTRALPAVFNVLFFSYCRSSKKKNDCNKREKEASYALHATKSNRRYSLFGRYVCVCMPYACARRS